MPNFACHLAVGAVSSALAVAYGDARYDLGNVCSTLAFLAGVSGSLLPDLDSDTSKPLRLSGAVAGLGAAAAVAGFALSPGNFLGRPWHPVYVAVAAFATFLVSNTLMIGLLKRYTVHRGLFHSLSVPFLYGGLWAVLCTGMGRKTVFAVWVMAAGGVFLHLILDSAKSLSLKPLKVCTQDLAASTRLWIATAMVNLLVLVNPFVPV
ncbi:MAG: metal-dependent hydrolase [Deltaproteobacteria bacterium]|nr:metal-dependent hydrolase [Deltaproteobacteria bacterium]